MCLLGACLRPGRTDVNRGARGLNEPIVDVVPHWVFLEGRMQRSTGRIFFDVRMHCADGIQFRELGTF